MKLYRGNSSARAMAALGDSEKKLIVHLGVTGRHIAGGMAQVIEEYLSWTYDRVVVTSMCSSEGKGDKMSLWRAANCARRLVAMKIGGSRFSVVVHLSQGGSFVREGLLIWLAATLGIAVAGHIHGSSFLQFDRRHPALVRAVLVRCAVVFVLTDSTRRAVLERTQNLVPVVRVPNAVKVPEYQEQKEPIVVFGGQVGYRKGVDTLLEAWGKLRGFDEWKLIIAGSIDSSWSVPGDIENVEFAGPLPRAELQRIESVASIAVLPSRDEALPMFLIESMARSCAVIGTSVGEVAELIGHAGLVVKPGDATVLASALLQLMDDRSAVQEYGEAARDRVLRSYSSLAVARTLEAEWLMISTRAGEQDD